MRNLTLLIGILFITLFSVNGQDSFRKKSIEKEETTLETSSIIELYDSIFDDFESWYKESTEREEKEESEMESIYLDIFNTLDIIDQVVEESKEDLVNNLLYSTLLQDFKNQ